MNAKRVMAGVLIEIPERMVKVYEVVAGLQEREFLDVVAADLNDVCQRYFKELELLDEQVNSGVGGKARKTARLHPDEARRERLSRSSGRSNGSKGN